MGIMIVYDVTSENSFQSVANWMSKIGENSDKKVNKIMIANKCDLEEERVITRERGEELAGSLGIPYVEISALSSSNVDEAFTTLAKDILNRVLQSGGGTGNDEGGLDKTTQSSCMSC